MLATLTIDDDIISKAQSLAGEISVSVDVMISDLLRQSLLRLSTVRPDNGFPVFPRTPGAQMIAVEDVRRADEDI